MNDERSPRPDGEQPAPPPRKQPYRPPAVAWEEPWDARANLMAACGRKEGMGGDCDADLSS